jgi:hypothetical protein|nr:MAG TPA: hypothetical protein [Caudoviricetes sp.]
MAKARIHVTKTAKTVKIAKNRNKQGGNHKRCPVCGKFMGSGKHG